MRSLTLRCSLLPLIELCAQAAVPPAIPIREESDAAEVGTHVHALLAAIVMGEDVNTDGETDEVRILVATGRKVLQSFALPNVEVEVAMSAPLVRIMLTGHADVVSVANNRAAVVDWKTGRKDADYTAQLKGYAALVMVRYPGVERVTATIAWLRDGEMEGATYTLEDIEIWLDALAVHLERGAYSPGGHCLYCPRAHECEARGALVRREVDAFVAGAERSLATMTAAEIVDLHERVQLVAALAAKAHGAIKAHVAEHGPIESDARQLYLDTETRRSLRTLDAFPVLEKHGFGDEMLAGVIKLSLSKAEASLRKIGGRKHGAAMVKALLADLEAAEAIERTEVTKLTTRRK